MGGVVTRCNSPEAIATVHPEVATKAQLKNLRSSLEASDRSTALDAASENPDLHCISADAADCVKSSGNNSDTGSSGGRQAKAASIPLTDFPEACGTEITVCAPCSQEISASRCASLEEEASQGPLSSSAIVALQDNSSDMDGGDTSKKQAGTGGGEGGKVKETAGQSDPALPKPPKPAPLPPSWSPETAMSKQKRPSDGTVVGSQQRGRGRGRGAARGAAGRGLSSTNHLGPAAAPQTQRRSLDEHCGKPLRHTDPHAAGLRTKPAHRARAASEVVDVASPLDEEWAPRWPKPRPELMHPEHPDSPVLSAAAAFAAAAVLRGSPAASGGPTGRPSENGAHKVQGGGGRDPALLSSFHSSASEAELGGTLDVMELSASLPPSAFGTGNARPSYMFSVQDVLDHQDQLGAALDPAPLATAAASRLRAEYGLNSTSSSTASSGLHSSAQVPPHHHRPPHGGKAGGRNGSTRGGWSSQGGMPMSSLRDHSVAEENETDMQECMSDSNSNLEDGSSGGASQPVSAPCLAVGAPRGKRQQRPSGAAAYQLPLSRLSEATSSLECLTMTSFSVCDEAMDVRQPQPLVPLALMQEESEPGTTVAPDSSAAGLLQRDSTPVGEDVIEEEPGTQVGGAGQREEMLPGHVMRTSVSPQPTSFKLTAEVKC
mmetsp:Transcript_6753/g.14920  ORF Transcript_6753/g.14920 Transcript_6753/m.14920 type:complete len:660 (+) Transcript_6753:143-2122(+)